MAETTNDILAKLKAAMETPEVKNSTPANLIDNMMNVLGIQDLEPVNDDDIKAVLDVYFQAVVLDKDAWTELPNLTGVSKYVQIFDFRLANIPDGTHVVADVCIDKSNYEVECFDQYVKTMEIRDKSVIFYAYGALPVDITIGLKCVDANGNIVVPAETDYRTRKKV